MASVTRRIGATFLPDHPPAHFRDVVADAEAAGLPELWLWEDCFREAAFSSAAAALAWTEKLRVGIGIAPMPLRNVAMTAMEIATIEGLFPGRLVPGVGHGVLSWMGQVGERASSPLTLMREYLPALRRLLAGETLSTDGRYVTLDDVALDWPPATAPKVYAAGEGPKTLRLTGEVADGTIISGGKTPERVAEMRAEVDAGAAAAGIPSRREIVVYVPTVFGSGAQGRIAAHLERWDAPGQTEKVVSGDVAAVARRVAEYYEAGADTVVLEPIDDQEHHRSYFENALEVASLTV